MTDKDENGDRTKTLQEWLRDQSLLEQAAIEAYPYAIDKCSHESLYQYVYACLTCRQKHADLREVDSFVCCYACHVRCHPEGHHLIELGPRRSFQCRCGPLCKLGAKNTTPNVIQSGHNFDGLFCHCRKPLTEADEVEIDIEGDASFEEDQMYQCLVCEDWFHGQCVLEKLEGSGDFVCSQHSDDRWLQHLKAKLSIITDSFFLPDGWRQQLCTCCSSPEWAKHEPVLYEPPLENSASLSSFEKDIQVLSQSPIVSPVLMEKGLKGMAKFKAAFMSFLAEKQRDKDDTAVVVTKADVDAFIRDFNK